MNYIEIKLQELDNRIKILEDKFKFIPDQPKTKFEEIWSRYPKKVGRKQAERHFKASVKTDQDWVNINQALDNYIKCKRVKDGFVQDGSRWFNNWLDWIEHKEIQAAKLYTQEEVMEENAKNGIVGTIGFKLIDVPGKTRMIDGKEVNHWYVKDK